jgi:hypothetical protein
MLLVRRLVLHCLVVRGRSLEHLLPVDFARRWVLLRVKIALGATPVVAAWSGGSVGVELEKWSASLHRQGWAHLFLGILGSECNQSLFLLDPLLLLFVLNLNGLLLQNTTITYAVAGPMTLIKIGTLSGQFSFLRAFLPRQRQFGNWAGIRSRRKVRNVFVRDFILFDLVDLRNLLDFQLETFYQLGSGSVLHVSSLGIFTPF